MFVHERAFEDICERLSEVRRDFGPALLIGTPDPSWPARLGQFASRVEAIEPGGGFAGRADARHANEETVELEPATFDLCVAMGTLDTVDDLPAALRRIRSWLRPDALLLGVIPGGATLPRLRSAMRAADAAAGAALPHVHPRIEAASLGHLLSAAGFVMPVVDVDRVRVAYSSLAALIADLRSMAATNVLRSRPRWTSRPALAAAEAAFQAGATDGRTVETFELLHFAAWVPEQG